jgi:hypothetical protein
MCCGIWATTATTTTSCNRSLGKTSRNCALQILFNSRIIVVKFRRCLVVSAIENEIIFGEWIIFDRLHFSESESKD